MNQTNIEILTAVERRTSLPISRTLKRAIRVMSHRPSSGWRLQVPIVVTCLVMSGATLVGPAWAQVLNENRDTAPLPNQTTEGVEQALGYFDTMRRSSGDDSKLTKEARAKLLSEITTELVLELNERQRRITTARLRLDAIEAKVNLSRNRINQIAQSRLEERLAELKNNGKNESAPQGLETPKAVLDRLAECLESKNIEGLVALLSDDAANELAGSLLLSTAGMSIVAKFAESVPDGMSAAELAAMRSAEKLIEAAVLTDPPAEAKKAYTELMQLYVAAMFSQPRPLNFPSMKDPLKTAAGMLREPRQFIVDACSAIQDVTGTDIISNSDDMEFPVKWNIRVDGDKAVANIDSLGAPEMVSNEIQLQRVNERWLISRLIREDMLKEMGGTVRSVAPPASSPTLLNTPADTSLPLSTPSTTPLSSPAIGTPASGNSTLQPLSSPRMPQPSSSGGDFGRDVNSYDSPVRPASDLGQDLTPDRTPEPVYSGRPIDYWLQTYWQAITSNQPYGNSLNAIKALRTQPSSDRLVEEFLASCYMKIANELDTSYLAKVADCIVTVAGPRHQKKAVDYLFRIAEKNPRTDAVKEVPYDFDESYFLRGALSGLKQRDESLAKQAATMLTNGSSRQRELAVAMFLVFRENKQFSDPSKRFEDWMDEHRDLLVPAFLAASRDPAAHVRSLALIHLGSLAPESVEFKTRLTEMVESEPKASLRTLAMMNLVSIQPDDPLVHRTLLSWARSGDRDLVRAAIDNMYPNEERGSQAIDELMELLEDKAWGRELLLDGSYPGSNGKTARQRAISALAYFEEQAERALPVLQKDLESGDPATATSAAEAIDQIVGFSESLPIESLAGDWTLVGLTKVDAHPSILPLTGEPTITIAGTRMTQRDQLVARLSKARSGREDVIRLLVDPENKKVRTTATYTLNRGDLKISLRPVTTPEAPIPQPTLGGGYSTVPTAQQVYTFRRVQTKE